jgi:hypothetical protein
MMRKFWFLATQLTFLCIANGGSSLAESLTLLDEIKAYDNEDYQQTIKIGRVLASENPHVASIHCYLANAYARLRLLDDARREYEICLTQTKDLGLKTYCEEAITILKDTVSGRKPQQSYPYAAMDKESYGYLLSGARNTIEGERLQWMNSAMTDEQRKEEAIRKRMQDDIDATPRVIWFGHHFETNPDYEPTVRNIRDQAKINIQTARSDLDYSLAKMEQSSQEKLGALDSSILNTPSQFDSGTSGTQLAPGNGLPFVKNYLNLKPSLLPPFPMHDLPHELKKTINSS